MEMNMAWLFLGQSPVSKFIHLFFKKHVVGQTWLAIHVYICISHKEGIIVNNWINYLITSMKREE